MIDKAAMTIQMILSPLKMFYYCSIMIFLKPSYIFLNMLPLCS